MADIDFHELAGRIEGTTRALLLLVAKLECTAVFDGSRYTDDLRNVARGLQMQTAHQGATQRTLNEIALSLELDRTHQAQRDPAEIQSG